MFINSLLLPLAHVGPLSLLFYFFMWDGLFIHFLSFCLGYGNIYDFDFSLNQAYGIT